jgi:hypothetical protein
MNAIELQGSTAESRNAWLKNILTNGVYAITFTKVNGEVRTMPCTLKASILPALAPVDESAEKKTRVPKIDNISVWCTDKNEWRSFKVMNVTQVEALDGIQN